MPSRPRCQLLPVCEDPDVVLLLMLFALVVQAWCCRRKLPCGTPAPPLRQCCRCNDFHQEWEFDGRHRTCKEQYDMQKREAARALNVTINEAAAVKLPRPPPRPVAEGQQTAIIGGMDASAQLGLVMGAALPAVLQEMAGSGDDTPENRLSAVHEIMRRAKRASTGRRRQIATNVPKATPRRPTHCVQCQRPTTIAGFGGRSVCMCCFATGAHGLSLVDLNYALESDAIGGKGAAPYIRPPGNAP